jgi:hypothetical protein
MLSSRLLRELFSVASWLVACGLLLVVTAKAAPPCPLEQGFRKTPTADRPWCYWWWLKGNVTKAAITADLEAMKKVGFSGLLHFDARAYHEDLVPPPPSRMEFMSPEWREMLKFSIQEAHRVGLEVSVNLSSCAGALKGPWLVGDDAPKKLVWTSAETRGPKMLACQLKPGAERFWDVALLAVRVAETEAAPAAGAGGELDLNANWHDVGEKLAARGQALEVVDLADKIVEGKLTWQVPAGRWTLIRFGCALMPGHEYDVDVLDPKAVTAHFNRMGKTILDDVGPLAGKTLTHFYSVSWEGAAPTWTLGFDASFKRLRGYCPRPYLPVLAGFTVQSPEISDRFSRDYHRSLGDLFLANFYGTLRDLCHQHGLKWHSESGGPWERKLADFHEADQLAFLARNDMPQGEFWVRGAQSGYLGQMMNRPPAMTAHTYGLRLAAVEAFTHMVAHWSVFPDALKASADVAFADGANQFIWHTFTLSLPEFGLPGSDYFAGTHINPRVTWWPEAPAFVDYLARCQFLLRQGKFVGDVCCYVGDNPYLHWGRATRWSDRPSLALGKGYTYDLINTEVLLTRAKTVKGDIVLPDGMRYRMLVVDLTGSAVPVEALRKLNQLADGGARIVLGHRRPDRAPGLSAYPQCDAEVRALTAALWNRADGPGRVTAAVELQTVLDQSKIQPDFVGPFDYLHRRTADVDIYFLAGKGQAECVFRVKGKQPELWCPVTGRMRDAIQYRPTHDGRTALVIDLPERGSVFVVFRRPAGAVRVESVAGPACGLELDARTETGIQASLWRHGTYHVATAQGHDLTYHCGTLPGPIDLVGPWTVRFQAGRGAPESATFEQLTAWDKHADPRIRYFSGTATYTKTFEVDAAQVGQPVRLALGEVKYIAHVVCNGRDLGTVWTAPWTADLSSAIRAGQNQLEVRVTNVWVNRLIGDAGLPPAERVTKSNIRQQAGRRNFKIYEGYAAEDPLMPSGWLGPARIEFGRQQTAGF